MKDVLFDRAVHASGVDPQQWLVMMNICANFSLNSVDSYNHFGGEYYMTMDEEGYLCLGDKVVY